ncbi:snRNA binding, partial [Halocaridina rubra]
MSVEVLLPSPRVNLLDSGTRSAMEGLALPTVCGPHRGTRRPSGTNESESDSPPSKKSKKTRRRRKRPRHRMRSKSLRTKPVAPFNTTQFLMAEHDQLQDTDIVARPRRNRDSSFSVDSEDQNNYYSSPDEDDFMVREFWNAYEDVHAERLDTMTKAQLVQEYLALEEKVDLLEMQLRAVRARHRHRNKMDDDEDDDDEVRPGEVKVDAETAQKISIFQNEINNLEMENRRLREENMSLRRSSSAKSSSSSSSSDSSSDSSSSSSSSSDSSSDSEDEIDNENRKVNSSNIDSVPPSPPSVMLTGEGEEGDAIVSASDKVVCQPDSHLRQEEESVVTEMEREGETAEAMVMGDLPDGGAAAGSLCSPTRYNITEPPITSSSISIEKSTEEDIHEGEDTQCKGLEEE